MKTNINLSLEAAQEEYFDPRLLAAQVLLQTPMSRPSILYPLIISACMAVASLIFAFSVILGPGWDLTGQTKTSHGHMVSNGPEHINGHADEVTAAKIESMPRASEFEISSRPSETAISASEAEGLTTLRN